MRPVSRAVKCTLLIFLEKWPLKLLLLMPFPRQPHPFFFFFFFCCSPENFTRYWQSSVSAVIRSAG